MQGLDLIGRRVAEAEAWSELEGLLARLEKQRPLSYQEIDRVAGLYRKAAARLAEARRRPEDRARLHYLESLVRRAHFVVYPAPRQGLYPVWALFLGGFALAFRRTGRLQGLAFVFFAAGALLAYVGVQQRVELAYPLLSALMPAETVQGLINSPEVRGYYITSGQGGGTGLSALFAAGLAANNTRAGMMAFAVGIAFGLPTILMSLFNGAVLGSMAGLYDRTGLDLDFWAWVLPHGVPEILALVICSAAGLSLGFALLDPKGRPRREALVEAGRGAMVLVGLALLLFLYAAVIEGWFRQLPLGRGPRFILAAVNFVLLSAYLGLAGRGADQASSRGS